MRVAGGRRETQARGSACSVVGSAPGKARARCRRGTRWGVLINELAAVRFPKSWCRRRLTAPKQAAVCEVQGWGPGRAGPPSQPPGLPQPPCPMGTAQEGRGLSNFFFFFFALLPVTRDVSVLSL